MSRRLLENALLLDPEADREARGSLLLEDGRIRARLAPGAPVPEAVERVDLAGRAVAPGFLELHFHGDLIFRSPREYRSGLARTAASLLRHGTTGFLATTVSWNAEDLLTRVKQLVSCVSDPPTDGATLLGIHLEGPWINPAAAGAHPRDALRPYDASEGGELLTCAGGAIRLVTLAPELPGAGLLQAELARRGIVAALGHSLADAAQFEAGVARGLRHVTHLFNAMGPLHHRAPGVAGRALVDDRLSCDLICDGVHVDPVFVRLAARSKRDRLVLITDRIELPAEAGSGRTSFGSGAVRDDGDALRLPDGTLAGSTLTLDRAIRRALEFGAMTRLEAIAACTVRAARLLGVERERGTFRPGSRADFAVLSAGGEVEETWLAGRRVWPA